MYTKIQDPVSKKSCLQYYISITSYINLLVSLVALGFGIYKAVQDRSAWEGTNYNWNKSIVGCLIAGSCFLFICSLAGIIGGRKNNRCCIFFFQIFGLVLAILFLFIGFAFLVITHSNLSDISKSDCTGSSNNTEIYKYGQQAYNLADQLLCTSQCPCLVTDEAVIQYMKNEKKDRVQYMSQTTGVKRVQECSGYDSMFSEKDVKSQANWLRSLEDSFSCTGMCTKPSDLYFFSDINQGLPDTDTCKEKFQSFVSSYGQVIYLVGIFVGFYLLINTILSCCLCCQKKKSGQSYYERFGNF